MSVKDLPPPIKTDESEAGNWSKLLDWLQLLWKFVRTPALANSNGNVPTSTTAQTGDLTTQIATDAAAMNAAMMMAFDGGEYRNIPGTWTQVVPTLTPQGGAFTTVTGVMRYSVVGKTCNLNITVTMTNIGTATGAVFFTLPFTATSSTFSVGCGRENAVNGKMLQGLNNANSCPILYYDGTNVMANGLSLIFSLTYEVL